jgi:hypothetical protein
MQRKYKNNGNLTLSATSTLNDTPKLTDDTTMMAITVMAIMV